MTTSSCLSSDLCRLRLKDQDQEWHQISDYFGNFLFLSFLPKVGAPDFTSNLIALQVLQDLCQEKQTSFLGIVDEPAPKLKKFIDQENLQLTLLSDVGHRLAEMMGVWKERSFLGKRFWGVERSSFWINAEGVQVDCCFEKKLRDQIEWCQARIG